jgi:hypothetical protein
MTGLAFGPLFILPAFIIALQAAFARREFDRPALPVLHDA